MIKGYKIDSSHIVNDDAEKPKKAPTHPAMAAKKNMDAKRVSLLFYALESDIRLKSGVFHDSKFYQNFGKSVSACKSVADVLAASQKKGKNYIKVGALSPLAQCFVTDDIKASMKDGKISLADAQEMLNRSFEYVQTCAKKYIKYKMADHTADPEKEPRKKKLISDDRNKLELMNSVLPMADRVVYKKQAVERRLSNASGVFAPVL